jgi:dethiobiotin synthetase
MPKGFFITGTDTGVGKTVITAALIKAIGLLGLKVCGMKPLETGCLKSEFKAFDPSSGRGFQSSEFKVKDEELVPSDGMFLREIAGMSDPIDFITPIRFKNPLAPLPASEIEGISVDFQKIQKAYTELSKKYDVIIVEGIGGLLVPITRDYSVLDLAKDFGLPLIIVSRPGLGTINHTMLTVNCATKEGLNVAGIIINYSHPPEGTLAEDTNPEIIRQISPVPIIGIFPYLEDLESNTIKRAAEKTLDIEIIKKYL